MSEIPEDVRNKAEDIVGELTFIPEHYDLIIEMIAKGILAERQRCADAAKAYLEDLAGCDLRDDEPDLIAAAILTT